MFYFIKDLYSADTFIISAVRAWGECLPDLRPFKNSNLFSNHYLEKLIKGSPEWRQEAGLAEAFAGIKELYEKKARVLENYNESQLEENFIRPVLRLLGHYFGVQGKVLGKDRTPDYAFFPDRESLDEAEARPGEDYYRHAIAVGDAKSWKISLDKSRKGQGSFEMLNPSFQIDIYLRDTPPKWAILTSGRLWRLYHEATSYKLDSYYEVDLPGLLNSGDLENFKYFYLFFRQGGLRSSGGWRLFPGSGPGRERCLRPGNWRGPAGERLPGHEDPGRGPFGRDGQRYRIL